MPLVLCGLMFTSPVLVLLPVTAWRGIDLQIGGEAWLWAAGAVVVSVVIPIALFYTGVQMIGAGATSIIGVGEPLAGVLLAFAILGESLTGLQLVGGALIIAGVVLLSLQAMRAPASAAAPEKGTATSTAS